MDLEELIKEFGCECYWYGEETGDYEMRLVEKTDFYKEFKKEIEEKKEEPDMEKKMEKEYLKKIGGDSV